MHRHRSAFRGLWAGVTVALGLWTFGRPMATCGAMPMRGSSAAANAPSTAPHGDTMPGRHGGGGDAGALCVACCPGCAPPPAAPLGVPLNAAPAVVASVTATPASQPHRPLDLHWQPLPIGPPAPPVS